MIDRHGLPLPLPSGLGQTREAGELGVTHANPRKTILRLWYSRTGYAIAMGVIGVLLRLICFDFRAYFLYQSVPNHDMYQGMSFFATNLHSVRLNGEIAWWNPATNFGYAQYYQSFLSPLAPTPGNIVFILWAEAIKLLASCGITIPEYRQYLVATFVVYPLICFTSFVYFLQAFFRSRTAIALVLITYVLSGIGLWNSAWFYFQEQGLMFFLLGSCLWLVKVPTLTRALVALSAVVIQFASLNYWTIYDSWFMVLVLGLYSLAHRSELGTLKRAVSLGVKRQRRILIFSGGLFFVTVLIWAVIFDSIAHEQASHYVRVTNDNGDFSIETAYDRVQEVRRSTTELFNPVLENALSSYKVINPIHNARYIGASLLPFLAMFCMIRWRREQAWLALLAASLFVICLAPPFLLELWKAFPFMDKIRHFFYFYSQYWQLTLVTLAACTLEEILIRDGDMPDKRLIGTCFAVGGVTGACLCFLAFTTSAFPVNSNQLQANLLAGVLVIGTCGVTVQYLLYPTSRSRLILASALLLVTTGDLGRYFWLGCRIDQAFTASERYSLLRAKPDFPLSTRDIAAISHSWNDPGPAAGFEGGLRANLPMPNMFWPQNVFMIHEYEYAMQGSKAVGTADDLSMYSKVVAGKGGLGLVPSNKLDCKAEISKWAYNDFTINIFAPRRGYLAIRQIADPLWSVRVDGDPEQALQANYIASAILVPAGPHVVTMSYRPLARRLYWPAAFALQFSILSLLGLAWHRRRGAVGEPVEEGYDLAPIAS